jgi:hypothetical protein
MTSAGLERMLAQLEENRRRFDRAGRNNVLRLLRRLGEQRFRDSQPLIHFHDALLFLRAHPHDATVARLAEALLATFHRRVEQLRTAGDDLEDFQPESVSGIAGAWIEDKLNFFVLRWLLRRHASKVEINWEGYDNPARMAATLPRFLPLLDDDAFVEADVPYLEWLRSASGRRVRDLEWLFRSFERLPLTAREQAELFDVLELPVRWELGNSAATRTRAIRPVRKLYLHSGPLIQRRDVSLEAEFAGPPLPIRRLSRRQGEDIIDMSREVLAVRYRELYGMTHGDPAHVIESDVGRGVQIYLWGVPPERRLPLRAYCAGFTLKNGVPVNYIEGISLFEWMEIGFNTFYAYRDGETAWIYAKVLHLLRQLLGVSCISVYPYQIGQDNEEAIQSGAFWFYRKLGFRPGRPELARLAQREEQKIATNPGYRTSARTLRKLAQGHIFYEPPGTPQGGWDRFAIRKIGFAVGRRMAERFGGNIESMRRGATAAVARTLGITPQPWSGPQRTALENFAMVLSLVPDLRRWSAEEKRDVVRIIRAKMGAEESGYLRMMQEHARLRAALLKLGA